MASLDPELSTPHGFWRYGANYLLAARALDVKLRDEGRLYFPILYLYGIAIELGLKAFLLKRGRTLREVYRMSHRLTDLVALARRHKLGRIVQLQRRELNAIRVLDVTYSSNQLRYIVTGPTKVPELLYVSRAAEELIVGLEHLCTGAKGRLVL